MALRVSPQVACPPKAVDGYLSPGDHVPYIIQLLSPLASPTHLVGLCDDGTLHMFDKTQWRAPMRTIRSTESEAITTVANLEDVNTAWVGASKGGYLALWDARAASHAPAYKLVGPSGAAYLSLATSGMYMAAGTELQGTDAWIDVWDARNTACPLRTYGEVHSDDITSLLFHQDTARHSGILLSGGMDGLVCAVDTHMDKEEDAVISVGNTNASLARVGWACHSPMYQFQPQSNLADVGMDANELALSNAPRRTGLGPVYAISHMQTMSLWDADKVCPVILIYKFDCLHEEIEVRKPTSFRPPWVTDYVIDTSVTVPFQTQGNHASVGLYVGDQDGGLAWVSAEAHHASSQVDWTLHARLPSASPDRLAHCDIVRCVLWDDSHQLLYTGGEDGRILAWSMQQSEPPEAAVPPPAEPGTPQGGRPRLTGIDASKRRYSPYA